MFPNRSVHGAKPGTLKKKLLPLATFHFSPTVNGPVCLNWIQMKPLLCNQHLELRCQNVTQVLHNPTKLNHPHPNASTLGSCCCWGGSVGWVVQKKVCVVITQQGLKTLYLSVHSCSGIVCCWLLAKVWCNFISECLPDSLGSPPPPKKKVKAKYYQRTCLISGYIQVPFLFWNTHFYPGAVSDAIIPTC